MRGAYRHRWVVKRGQPALAVLICVALAVPAPFAQTPPAAVPSASPAQAADAKSFSQPELDQLLAPVALYPDALLAQVLMASTYPLEVVSADRWRKSHPGLEDKALEDALQGEPWDPSVKSLAAFPQVLTMMSEKLDWTQKLGDAVLAQQKDVMATVQALRAKAVAAGTLQSSSEQTVSTQTVNNETFVTIEPAEPEVVYVPTYDPTIVYGTWPYPAYPPYYWYPPGYYGGGALLGFAAGIIVGKALWGRITWGGDSPNINIDVDRFNNFNRSNISDKNWRHNAEHRGAVPYRDQKVAQRYGRGQAGDAASRDAFRGRADEGRGAIQRGEVSTRDLAGRDLGSRDAGRATFGGSDLSGTRGPTAFDTGRGAQTRDYSSRGASSMGSARSSGGVRGGGAVRGGGGGRGGGRR